MCVPHTAIAHTCLVSSQETLRLVALGLPREYDLRHTMEVTTNSKEITLLIIDRFVPF